LYENQPAEIDTGPMEDICQVQKEVLLTFKEITVGYARLQLWNKNAGGNKQIKIWSQLKGPSEAYFAEEDGLCFTVVLPPSPPGSRQPTSTELFHGSTSLLTAEDVPRKRQRIEIAD
jgi:hypothetical protein